MLPGEAGVTPDYYRSGCSPRSEEFYTIPGLRSRMKSVVD